MYWFEDLVACKHVIQQWWRCQYYHAESEKYNFIYIMCILSLLSQSLFKSTICHWFTNWITPFNNISNRTTIFPKWQRFRKCLIQHLLLTTNHCQFYSVWLGENCIFWISDNLAIIGDDAKNYAYFALVAVVTLFPTVRTSSNISLTIHQK